MSSPILIPAQNAAPQPGGNSPGLTLSPSSTKRFQRTKKVVTNTAEAMAAIRPPKALPSNPPAPSNSSRISAPAMIARGSQASSTAVRVLSITRV
jgi:hypothetical protein